MAEPDADEVSGSDVCSPMSQFDLVSFPDDSALAQAGAGRWLDAIESGNRLDRQFVAVSGGRIARHFFAAVATAAKSRKISLAGVHFFWADERCVPPTDPESNFRLADENLFQPLHLPAENVHRIRGEVKPSQAAQIASDEIRRVVPCAPDGQPILDLVFLGMGEDGHVASLFPGSSPADVQIPDVYQAVVASKPPPHRLTLGYPAIAAAREVWVLASGAGKENALRESLSPQGRTPLARVIQLRSRTQIFTDIKL